MAMSIPIEVKTFEFSDSKDLEDVVGKFALWNMKGASANIIVLAATQSSWVLDGQVKHMLTVLYREEK